MADIKTPTDEDFLNHSDDDKPVTRGELRKLAVAFRQDLKWFAVATVIANQTLNHIQVPPITAYVGGAVAAVTAMVVFALKMVLAR